VGIDIVRRMAHKPSSVPDARAALSPLEPVVDPHTFETLRLLVTELVTATVRHGTPSATHDIELWVSASRERIRVEVADSGRRAHTSAEGPGLSELGLHLVETLSDRCGTEGKGCDRFWLELVDSGAFTPESKEYAAAVS
jgi:two-component sensor histidine kinase